MDHYSFNAKIRRSQVLDAACVLFPFSSLRQGSVALCYRSLVERRIRDFIHCSRALSG